MEHRWNRNAEHPRRKACCKSHWSTCVQHYCDGKRWNKYIFGGHKCRWESCTSSNHTQRQDCGQELEKCCTIQLRCKSKPKWMDNEGDIFGIWPRLWNFWKMKGWLMESHTFLWWIITILTRSISTFCSWWKTTTLWFLHCPAILLIFCNHWMSYHLLFWNNHGTNRCEYSLENRVDKRWRNRISFLCSMSALKKQWQLNMHKLDFTTLHSSQ